jgi:hypothetical protein
MSSPSDVLGVPIHLCDEEIAVDESMLPESPATPPLVPESPLLESLSFAPLGQLS